MIVLDDAKVVSGGRRNDPDDMPEPMPEPLPA